MDKTIGYIPMIMLDDIQVFPNSNTHFMLEKGSNYKSAQSAIKNNGQIVVLQEAETKAKCNQEDTCIGIIADISQIVRLGKTTMRVMLKAKNRVNICDIRLNNDVTECIYEEISQDNCSNSYECAGMLMALKDVFGVYAAENAHINPFIIKTVEEATELGRVVDFIAANISVSADTKRQIIVETDVIKRCDILITRLAEDVQICRVRNEYKEQVQQKVDKNQKEYYLKEQLALIKEELGDSTDGIVQDFYDKCDKLDADKAVKEHIYEEINHYEEILSSSQEAAVSRTYIELLLALPWNKKSRDNMDIINVRKVLDRDHYGLSDVKERITESLAVRALNEGSVSPIICLVGPPGTGKTSVAKSVAEALNRKYARICLGGVRDEAEIRGHRRTYIGAMPGRIINALKKTGAANPLLLLDEIDKVSSDYKGDVFSALLEVLDPEQNEYFTDHYVEVPVDLSSVMFICTANSTDTIPEPLLDRMEIISISGYTSNEKFHIAKKHLIKRQIAKNGLKAKDLTIYDSAIKDIIQYYTREAGVRGLERCISKICRKTAKHIVSNEPGSVRVTAKNLSEYLGKKIYRMDEVNKKDELGIVRGLAWTSCGGETLEIEVNVMHGKGDCELTGQMGDVMKESAITAISYVRSQSDKYNIDEDFFEKNDIHIHIPEGAVPKDGPSAGITMATAIMSAVCANPVRADVAMTGEITLRGRVLPIGGLKEKLLAAKTAGVTTVLVPEQNKSDVYDIDNEITDGMELKYVNNMEQVINNAFVTTAQP